MNKSELKLFVDPFENSVYIKIEFLEFLENQDFYKIIDEFKSYLMEK